MAGAKHKEVMEVGPEELWKVITDYESYPDFLEGVESTKVTKREGNAVYAEYVMNMFGKKFRYILKHTEEPHKHLQWEMVEGEFFKHNNGSWELKEKGKGKVEATYSVDVGFPLLVPQMIVNALTGTRLPSMMQAFQERAREQASKKPTKKPAKKAKK